MFVLTTKSGKPVLMENGSPFTYTVRWTADLAKKILEEVRNESLRVVKFA